LKNSFRGTKKPGTAGLIGAFVQNTETQGVCDYVFCAIYHLAKCRFFVYTQYIQSKALPPFKRWSGADPSKNLPFGIASCQVNKHPKSGFLGVFRDDIRA
jgi:hypothetical protein